MFQACAAGSLTLYSNEYDDPCPLFSQPFLHVFEILRLLGDKVL